MNRSQIKQSNGILPFRHLFKYLWKHLWIHVWMLLFVLLLPCASFAPSLLAAPKAQAWDIGFRIRHAFKAVDGKLRLKNPPPLDKHIAADQGYRLLSPVEIPFAITSLTTFNSNRDSHMLETLLYPRYKTGKVRITQIKPIDSTHYRITGQLTLVGKTRSFTSTATTKDDFAKGGFSILLSDFGIEPPSLLFMKVHDKVEIFYKVPLPPILIK